MHLGIRYYFLAICMSPDAREIKAYPEYSKQTCGAELVTS